MGGIVGEGWGWCYESFVSILIAQDVRKGGLRLTGLVISAGFSEIGTMLSVSAASLWKRLRFLTISFENSRAP